MEKLYEDVLSSKKSLLGNFSLMHFVGVDDILCQVKTTSMKMYLRARYSIMAEANFKGIFVKHIGYEQLRTYYQQYNVYSSIVKLSQMHELAHTKVLSEYQQRLASSSPGCEITDMNFKYFLYDFVVMVNFVDLKKFPESQYAIVDNLTFMYRIMP